MHVSRISLQSFRSYAELDLELEPGATTLVAPNGIGKTNLIEAIGYLATLGSHRVSADAPLIQLGSDLAVIRAQVRRGSRQVVLELSITARGANRARINRVDAKPRDLLGFLRTVLFAPEDLQIVKGDPGDRRRFLDDLLVSRRPRMAGVLRDYERALKQRNALLKSARGGRWTDTHESTLSVWDESVAGPAGMLVAARLDLVDALRDPLREAYGQIAGAAQENRRAIGIDYESPVVGPEDDRDPVAIGERLLSRFGELRRQERDRGITLAGPHRDELALTVGDTPVRGFASHGESWSYALGLKLASWMVHRADADDPDDWPVLILDDVFAELDAGRRARLAELVADAEQLLITAAVEDDLPPELGGSRLTVIPGGVGDA